MHRLHTIRTLTVSKETPLLTPDSLAVVLAYIHRFAPDRLGDARFLRAGDLRVLAAWIGLTNPRLRSLRHHTLLAGHITLLRAAKLLSIEGSSVCLKPMALEWLYAEPAVRLEQLLDGLHSPAWDEAVECLRLEQTLTCDYVSYLDQTLRRQMNQITSASKPYAEWKQRTSEAWQLHLCDTLPPQLRFELLQLGNWTPLDQILTMTPLTVATAGQRGYSLSYITFLVEEATGQPLDHSTRRILQDWFQRRHAYQAESVRLLSTRQPAQLAELMRQKRLRPHIMRQIGPRQALVSKQGISKVRRWLAHKGYPLASPERPRDPHRDSQPDIAFQWVGLRLLVALGDLIPLPYAAPHSHLEALSAQLEEEEQAQLEALCQKITSRLQQAISGRDAFFPARVCPSPTLLAQIEEVICEGGSLEIDYQGLGEAEPRRRHIYPLRLEQRGQLFYLHAYCLLAEAERTFRLDRLHGCRVA